MTNDNDARGVLTDEQIVAIAAKCGIGPNSAIEFARAILAAPRQPGEVGAGVQRYFPDFDRCVMQESAYGAWVRYEPSREFTCQKQACDGYCRDCYKTSQVAASAQQDEREALDADDMEPLLIANNVPIEVWAEVVDFGRDLLKARASQQVQADAGAVAWYCEADDGDWLFNTQNCFPGGHKGQPLYTRPAAESDKRDGLTDRQQHTVDCVNAWLKDAGLPAYSAPIDGAQADYVLVPRIMTDAMEGAFADAEAEHGTAQAMWQAAIRAAMSREQSGGQ